jgi:hypothetical protein
MFIVGVDLGQSQDYTAISVVERVEPQDPAWRQTVLDSSYRPRPEYHLRYLHRPPLGTRYPAIVELVLGLLGRAPLDRGVPLVVDRTGVGAAVVDLFAERGKRPHAVTITGGDAPNTEDWYNLRVPKRDLVGTLVALYQTGRLKVAEGLELAPTLANELVNFKVKVSLDTGHDSYESWRESVHDDLVLSVALACWFGESGIGALPFGWYRNARAAGQQQPPEPEETHEQRAARRLAARGWPNPWLPERSG